MSDVSRPDAPDVAAVVVPSGYGQLLDDVIGILAQARAAAARSVNQVMTATYWQIGQCIVEVEQAGAERATYGDALIVRLSTDLTEQFGRGFSARNLRQFRQFYLAWPAEEIWQTVSAKSPATTSAVPETGLAAPDTPALAKAFPLPWSAYVRLLSVKSAAARRFYETEALRGGWTVRQLSRQIGSMFYERTALSRDKAAMLTKGAAPADGDSVAPEQAIKDPFVLEFLGLKDEYSETDLEDALITHLADFLLELGGDFTFVARQRRPRIDDTWFRVDLTMYHRRRSWQNLGGRTSTARTSRLVSRVPNGPITATSSWSGGWQPRSNGSTRTCHPRQWPGRRDSTPHRVTADRVGELERLPLPDPRRTR